MKLHVEASDYLVVCDYHDDVLMLDSPTAPTGVHFYQIKTGRTKRWTIPALLRQEAGKAGALPSAFGKLFRHSLDFQGDIRSLTFVANLPFKVSLTKPPPSDSRIEFTVLDLAPAEVARVKEQLRAELALGLDPVLTSSLVFQVSALSVDGHVDGTKGRLVDFLNSRDPSRSYPVQALYRTIADEIERRTNVEGAFTAVVDLVKYRQTVGTLSNERVFVEQQIRLAEHVIRELRDDYDFTMSQPEDVECPTCGAMYHNSVLERFGLALSESDCVDILVMLRRRLGELESAISASTTRLKGARERHQALWNLLNSRRDALTLHEILRGEARGQAIDVLDTELSAVRGTLDGLSRRVEAAKDEMKAYETPGRRADFLERFSARLSQYCVLLNVPAPKPLRTFAYTPHETGSDVPRAVLAHNYAVLSMAWESRNPTHAPVIIDSPNQQDQDPVNLRLMLEFIRARTHQDAQIIIGLVDPQGVDFGGAVIELTAKRSILNRERYDDVGLRLEDLVSQMSLALANQ